MTMMKILRRRILVCCAVLGAACARTGETPTPAPETAAARPQQAFASDLTPLQNAIRARLQRETAEYGIAIIDIETGRSTGVNEDLVMHAASTMKVPVLLELYRRAAAGQTALDDSLVVRTTFRSIADTSHYSLSAADDSEKALYDLAGRRVTFRELGRRMTVRSSNLATNILIDTLRAPTIQATADRVGGSGMRVLRGVEDGPAFRAGMNNTTTARGLANVLAAIARCDILPRAHCEQIVDVLAAQEFNEMIPAGLPPGTRIAHKTGTITGIRHDGGIVYPANSPPFVLVVLTRGAANDSTAHAVARDVSRLTWDALGPGGSLRPSWPAAVREVMALHDRYRVPAYPAPRLPYDELWGSLTPIAGRASLKREQVGQSASGKPIYLISAGRGETRVLFWSQMHGDETTASRALTDLFNYITSAPDDARVRRWLERLSIHAVPMLNPDGADLHRRRSLYGIDVNRDARSLATPEGRTLKAAQERLQPHFGFNLHDQNPRSRVGNSTRTAAISLLAPPPDARATRTPGFVRALHLTAHLTQQLSPFVGEHLTQYDDSFNPRAFGDNMQAWGVSTVLIETGSWKNDESKHYLRKVNFAALVSALDAIAGGSYQQADIAVYTSLPENGRSLNDLLIAGGQIVMTGLQPYRADITIDAESVGGPAATQIVEVGDLLGTEARDTLDATGLFIHTTAEVHPGRPVSFQLRRTADPASELVWTIEGISRRRFVAR
jgi:beta-lactamase class A